MSLGLGFLFLFVPYPVSQFASLLSSYVILCAYYGTNLNNSNIFTHLSLNCAENPGVCMLKFKKKLVQSPNLYSVQEMT